MPAQLVVLVTGCSESGIGYELCKAFAVRGCKVFAAARRLQAMPGLTQHGIELLQLDVTDSAAVKAAVATVADKAGRIDILVNNAGVVLLGPTAEVPLESVKAGFAVNVFGLLDMCQAVTPLMAQAGSGRIINIGSLTGFAPVPLRGIYSATKAAVMRLSDSLRIELGMLGIQVGMMESRWKIELGMLGIQVMLVAPGFIQTNARDTAKDAALKYSSNSIWTNWLSVLESAMAKLLVGSVPADYYAQKLVDVAMQPHLPRYWVGPCAGREWLVRFLPLWMQDRLLCQAMQLQNIQLAVPQQSPAGPSHSKQS